MSGQELVWEAIRLLDLPKDRDYQVIALRPQIWGAEVRAEVTARDGLSLSAEVSEHETVEEVSAKITRLIDEVVKNESDRSVEP